MKGGNNMKHFYIGVLVAVITITISVGFAYQKHSHNQDLYYLKQASKIMDRQLLHKITKLEQEIRILKANNWF